MNSLGKTVGPRSTSLFLSLYSKVWSKPAIIGTKVSNLEKVDLDGSKKDNYDGVEGKGFILNTIYIKTFICIKPT